MKRERCEFTSGNDVLVGIKDIPDEVPSAGVPGVILLHGLGNHKTDCPLINETSEALVKQGYICFRFDFFGSGESPGILRDKTWSLMEQNARDGLQYFCQDGRVTSVGLWGRSSGGTIGILIGDDPRIRVFVLLSTPVLLQRVFGASFLELARLEREEGVRLSGTGEFKGPFEFREEFYSELPRKEEQLRRNLRRIRRVLVIGTTPDVKVSLDNSTTIMNTVKEPKKIHVFENTDHGYEGRAEEATELIVDWFNNHLWRRSQTHR